MRTYQLKISLLDVKPTIWVRLQVSAEASFVDLHKAIMTFSNWVGYHMHDFKFAKSNVEIRSPDEDDIDPTGFWQHMAEQGHTEYAEMLKNYVKPAVKKPTTKLLECFDIEGECIYMYDYGDGWECKIKLEKTVESDAAVIILTDFSGKWPPEDCGGAGGYMDLLETLKDPKSEDYQDMTDWISDMKYEDINISEVNKKLAKVFKKR